MNQNCLLDKSIRIERFIGKVENENAKNCIIFFGGVHGNEPSGFVALHRFFKDIEQDDLTSKFNGSIFGLTGNIQGLHDNVRFLKSDLNRIWTPTVLKQTHKNTLEELEFEFHEQKALLDIINHLIKTRDGMFHFVDLHTTSAPTMPFVTINDTIANRKLAEVLPIPTVLGIEEFLEGTIMDFINDLGYPAIGLESGQHCDPKSVEIHYASIWITLVAMNAIHQNDVPNYDDHFNLLKTSAGKEFNQVYAIKHREAVIPDSGFEMNPNFSNFQNISKNEFLATSKKGKIESHFNGKIFMPLYQKLGTEGFFIIQKIKPFWLKISLPLRSGKFESILIKLPGINRDSIRSNVLIVNKNVARFFSTDFMHLLGYRKMQKQGELVYFTKREVPIGNWPYYLN